MIPPHNRGPENRLARCRWARTPRGGFYPSLETLKNADSKPTSHARPYQLESARSHHCDRDAPNESSLAAQCSSTKFSESQAVLRIQDQGAQIEIGHVRSGSRLPMSLFPLLGLRRCVDAEGLLSLALLFPLPPLLLLSSHATTKPQVQGDRFLLLESLEMQ